MSRHIFPTTIGACAIAWDDRDERLTSFSLPNSDLGASDNSSERPPWICDLAVRVQLHLAGTPRDFSDAPYAFERVTEFQRDVYLQTLAVKSGRTRSYGELAASLALPPGGSRAVAAALGANPWPLLIPCHRIIGATGKMTGFSGPGGIATKTQLLALEGARLL